MKIILGNSIGVTINNFIAKYQTILHNYPDLLGYTITFMEMNSEEAIDYFHNPLFTDFKTDIATPYLIMKDNYQDDNSKEYTIYRFEDWCAFFTQEENDALLFHEIGHLIRGKAKFSSEKEKEYNADDFAANMVGKSHVKTALKKILSNNLCDSSESTITSIENRISLL